MKTREGICFLRQEMFYHVVAEGVSVREQEEGLRSDGTVILEHFRAAKEGC